MTADRVLPEGEGLYEHLFDLSPDPTVLHDGAVVLRANQAAVEYLGLGDVDSAVGVPIADFVHAEDRPAVAARVRTMLAEKTAVPPCVERYIRTDGTVVSGETVAAPITYQGRTAVTVVIRDMTARLRAEAALRESERRYREELELLVAQRTQALHEARSELDAVMAVVMRAVELRDPYTAGHQRRVAELADAIAHHMGLEAEDCSRIRVAAELHDIGKLSVPAEILSKPATLSAAEYELVKGHAQAAADILESVSLDWPLAQVVGQHHERMDGSGYPLRLTGEETLPFARLLAVADVVEAMVSHRPYRPAKGLGSALDEVLAGRGTRYDPAVVDACEAAFSAGFAFEA